MPNYSTQQVAAQIPDQHRFGLYYQLEANAVVLPQNGNLRLILEEVAEAVYQGDAGIDELASRLGL